jgi:hypothetical protein
MKVLERGHTYELKNKHEGSQVLTFFKDLPHDDHDNHDGVLCQEVLRALIDRVIDLNTQVPCHENIDIITKLRETLILFETRAYKRMLEKSYAKMGQNVEEIETEKNGHIVDCGFIYVDSNNGV